MDFFEKFPTELREKIMTKLNVEDLLRCSLVSKMWRSRVNSDLVWRRHCRRKLFTVSTMEKYKEALFYKYNYNPESTSLESLCLWRLVYSVNRALMQRWQDGQWKRTVFKKTPHVYCLDCDEEYLTSGHEDGSIFVWSVHLWKLTEEVNDFRAIQCLLKGTPVTAIRINGQHVLALQKQLLQIYSMKDDALTLVGTWSYELGEGIMDLTQQAKLLGTKFDHWYKECLRNYDVYPIRKLKFLAHKNLCFASVGGSAAVDIWTMDGAPKAYLTGFINIRNIVENCGDVYIISGNSPTVINRYCWTENEADKVISVNGFKRIVFGDEYILAIPHPSDVKMTMLWVWNMSYRLIRSKVLSSAIVSAVATSVVVYSENYIITVWNPKTDMVLRTFSVGASVGFMRHAHSTILVLFVNASLDAWDFLKGKRLCRLYSRLEWSGDFRELLWLNPSTVIAGGVRNNIQLLRYFYFI
ncbi:F-box and WD repeat domain-containing 11-B [Halyomorpha halys]|uniref:F-box and WD repeat domain-containing 11-B n=1 Tax=Halyomorpha halys TaxID=286706 RepID=UPI0006D5082F|nr:uncharacterized protein LOC106690594 [Halyomorpha halys]XP_014291565.1 uncharacterized protein LOC106690594 [Halyomorpha halys]